jgi:nicotinamidase-related amidase
MKTLILIDFQSHYLGEVPEEKRKELIKNVIRISKVFMANDWPIILVQFIDCGQLLEDDRLIQEIQDILSYENSILVTKDKCDGSVEILDAIDLNKFPLDLLIGGVYTNECVVLTIDGLIEKDKHLTINVLEDCIWPNKNTLIIDNDNTDRIKINSQDSLVLV